jgi:hypothetical protein
METRPALKNGECLLTIVEQDCAVCYQGFAPIMGFAFLCAS